MALHIQTIYLEEKTAFAHNISAWLVSKGFDVIAYDESNEQNEIIDAVVLFHEFW